MTDGGNDAMAPFGEVPEEVITELLDMIQSDANPGEHTNLFETPREVDPRVAWRANAVVLYDLFIGCVMDWPALTVSWLPDVAGEGPRLAVGMQTDGTENHEVRVVELDCDLQETIGSNPWSSFQRTDLGECKGFGVVEEAGNAPLKTVARLKHPTEVNRIASCPHRATVLATKAANGAVLLFDYKAERNALEVCPDASLIGSGESVDGFALGWSSLHEGHLASGGNDGRLCVWDVQTSCKLGATAPIHDFKSHDGAVCDLAFSTMESAVLATVGDSDRLLRLWDTRVGSTAQLSVVASEDEVLSVDWSHHREHTLATSGKDRDVRIWDVRSPSKPTKILKGHTSDAVVVRWAPFREDLLASCSADSRLNIWDLVPKEDNGQAEDDDEEVEDVPELLFSHAGHFAAISDFSWSPTDDYLMCSVDEDNALQIWQPNAGCYLADSDAEQESPAAGQKSAEPLAKRPRGSED